MRAAAAVLALVLLAFGLRAAFALHGIAYPESSVVEVDPDRYREHGQALVHDGRWRWTLDAVVFADGASGFIKSPLYQVFLSMFAWLTPDYPRYVPLGHAALGALTTAAVFLLGQALHSARAGVIAAAIYAIWLISIVSVRGYWQEHLYIPVITFAAAWMARSFGTKKPGTQIGAGLLLGLAALTRSMAVWLAPVALLFRRRRAIAVFAIVIAPYVLYLSMSLGHFVLLENVGPAYLWLNDPPTLTPPSPKEPQPFHRAPMLIGRQIAADPVHYARAMVFHARTTLTIAPHRWLEFQAMFRTEGEATIARALTWIATATEVVVLVLAPLGVAVARNRPGAALVGAWIVLPVVLTSVAAHQGPRFRAPVDPLLIALASAVLAGAWVRATRLHLAMAAGGMLLVAGSIALTLPHAIRIRGDYGLTAWNQSMDTRVARMRGLSAGFGVHPIGGAAEVRIRCAGSTASLTVAIEGIRREIPPLECANGPVSIALPTTHRYRYVTVSLDAPAAVEVEVFDDHISPEMVAEGRGMHLATQPNEWPFIRDFARGSTPWVRPCEGAHGRSRLSLPRSRSSSFSPPAGQPGSVIS